MTKEKKSEYNKTWYEKHKEAARERTRKWRADNQDKVKANRKKFYQKYKSLKSEHVRKPYADELTKEYLISKGISYVSKDGTSIIRNGKELRTFVPNKSKYLYVIFYIGCVENVGEYQLISVQRLVYAWHNGVAHKGMVIDHKDENKLNNSIDNLQEITPSQNIRKSRKAGSPIILKKKVNVVDMADEYNKTMEAYEEAKRVNDQNKAHLLRAKYARILRIILGLTEEEQKLFNKLIN